MLQIATKNKNSRRSDLILMASPDLSRVRELVSDETEKPWHFSRSGPSILL